MRYCHTTPELSDVNAAQLRVEQPEFLLARASQRHFEFHIAIIDTCELPMPSTGQTISSCCENNTWPRNGTHAHGAARRRPAEHLSCTPARADHCRRSSSVHCYLHCSYVYAGRLLNRAAPHALDPDTGFSTHHRANASCKHPYTLLPPRNSRDIATIETRALIGPDFIPVF